MTPQFRESATVPAAIASKPAGFLKAFRKAPVTGASQAENDNDAGVVKQSTLTTRRKRWARLAARR